jgi:hypothetical protein
MTRENAIIPDSQLFNVVTVKIPVGSIKLEWTSSARSHVRSRTRKSRRASPRLLCFDNVEIFLGAMKEILQDHSHTPT